MKQHIADNADNNSNLWCHLEGCKDTYTPYRVNVWGLKTPGRSQEDGWQMVEQQVNNTSVTSKRFNYQTIAQTVFATRTAIKQVAAKVTFSACMFKQKYITP